LTNIILTNIISIYPVYNSCRHLPQTKRHSSVSRMIWF
jgi:hypothetical protein